MNRRAIVPGAAAAAGMLVLILDGRTALTGAQEGIWLCLRTVIPSLFPFFVLSGILVGSLLGSSVSLLRPVGTLLGMPEGTESLLIGGFLGGYPVGARGIRDAWKQGSLSREDAERLLCFCNNAGPAFLFGMAAPLFSKSFSGWVLWGIQLASSLGTGMLLRRDPRQMSPLMPRKPPALMDSIRSALTATAQVCGWVVLFRIITCFLERWFLWLLPVWAATGVTGLLELSNGCIALADVESESLRFLLCSTMLSSGGLCVGMQTASVTEGLSLKGYCLGKLTQTLLSILFSALYLKLLSPWWLCCILLFSAVKKIGKRGRIPLPNRV